MKKTLVIVLLVATAAVCAQAQEMRVIRTAGQVNQFQLDSIRSLTFGVGAAAAKSALQATNDILCIHTGAGTSRFLMAGIDSVRFVDQSVMNVHLWTGVMTPFSLADIDSVTFATSPAHTVTVTYSGATATVVNPLVDLGVAVQVTGADVIVTSTSPLDDIAYVLAGTTTDGMFKIYSGADFSLVLGGVHITNVNGPAINVQADETITVVLADGTASVLTDGATYAAAPAGEDQKAAFFSEGQMIFTGTGSVTVNGRGTSQHGLGSDDYIDVRGGSIVVASAVKDGIHTNEGYHQQGGAVQVTSTSDGVDAGGGPIGITGGTLTVLLPAADKDAVKCAGEIQIAGGVLDLTVQGNQSKGLNAADVLLTGGAATIRTSGGVVLEASGSGYDPSYCTAVKADNLVRLAGCQLTITTTGVAGRGISSDGRIIIESGTLGVTSSGGGGTYTNALGVLDAYHGPCLNADGDLTLSGGTVTLSHSGSAGKGIAGDADLTIGTTTSSPTLHITTTGTKISLGSGEYAEAKAVSIDSTLTINNGQITVASADDAFKAKIRIDVYGGLVNVSNSVEGFEAPNLYIHGGEIHVTSTDDGLNATYGNDIEGNDGSILTISGGYVHLSAPSGDGIDSNGNLTISGGSVIVHGPGSQPEVAVDVNGTFLVNGGFLVASQIYSMMVETPSGASTQRCVLLNRSQALTAGTLFHIEDTSGNSQVTFAPARSYSSILVSTSSLTSGTTYRVYTGGACTGTLRDGVYTGGTYSGGTLRTTFTSTGMVQTITF
jgi:trimeric autotransporter adhesin